VAEPLVFHRGLTEGAALNRATELLAEVGIARPREVAAAYPHQLSGGMKQRALIATALACEPRLLLLDEPTTALDVTIEAQILDLLERLRAERGLSILFVSHNLGVIDRLCDDLCVLYAGRVVERGVATEIFRRPRHPYTKGLLASLPRPQAAQEQRLSPIPGGFPDLTKLDAGCHFRARCLFAEAQCATPQSLVGGATGGVARCWKADTVADLPWRADAGDAPAQTRATPAGQPILTATGVRKTFRRGGWLASLRFDPARPWWPRWEPSRLAAVDGVSLQVRPGEVLGLVGESGCGKSTLGRALLNLIPADQGVIEVEGLELGAADRARLKQMRRRAQIVFQNPDSTLNPRHTVGDILRRPVELFGIATGAAAIKRVDELLELVRLSPDYARRYPHQLSGGERQRVAIARALSSEPAFILCDEAVSALDVSIQAAILNLLADLRDRLGVAYLFISHDLSVIAHLADRVAVMYRGAIVEEGAVAAVLRPPYHPYTEALLSAIPIVGARRRSDMRVRLRGDAVDPAAGSGCRFHQRCPRKLGAICETTAPPVQDVGGGHRIACHIDLATLAAVPPQLGGAVSP
jgi:peptide/nickel transport system ATP-binding protein